MNAKATEKLLKLLERHGVEHFRHGTVEVKFKTAPVAVPGSLASAANSSSPSHPQAAAARSSAKASSKAPPTAAAAPPVEIAIPHHENEVTKLLRLSDEDLVDRLFPEAPGPSKEA